MRYLPVRSPLLSMASLTASVDVSMYGGITVPNDIKLSATNDPTG